MEKITIILVFLAIISIVAADVTYLTSREKRELGIYQHEEMVKFRLLTQPATVMLESASRLYYCQNDVVFQIQGNSVIPVNTCRCKAQLFRAITWKEGCI
jgi:hypothetical protein